MTEKKVPQRRCTGCNESKDKRELIRVLKTTEGNIIIDKTGRQNGRGAYICNSTECLKKAMKTKGLERSLKTSIPQTVLDDLIKDLQSKEMV